MFACAVDAQKRSDVESVSVGILLLQPGMDVQGRREFRGEFAAGWVAPLHVAISSAQTLLRLMTAKGVSRVEAPSSSRFEFDPACLSIERHGPAGGMRIAGSPAPNLQVA